LVVGLRIIYFPVTVDEGRGGMMEGVLVGRKGVDRIIELVNISRD